MPSSTTRWISDCTRERCFLRARPLLHQRVDQQVEERGVALELLPIGAMHREQHALEFVVSGIGAVGGLAQPRLERAQPGGGDLLEQLRLGGEIAVDVGVRHARLRGDADDGRARRAELAHMRARDVEQTRFDGFGRCGKRQGGTRPQDVLDLLAPGTLNRGRSRVKPRPCTRGLAEAGRHGRTGLGEAGYRGARFTSRSARRDPRRRRGRRAAAAR